MKMKLNYKRTFFIGLAFMSISAFWQTYDNIIPLILQNTFHLEETFIGIIMAADNILALLLLPLFGSLSDRTDTRLGKRTPFILAGTCISVLFMLLLPVMDRKESLFGFVLTLFVVLLSMGLYRSPAVALMPDLTPKPLRSQANAVINLMGAIGGVYALILISTLVGTQERPDYQPLYIGIAVAMLAAVILLLVTIREKKLTAQLQAQYPDEDEEIVDSHGIMEPAVKKSLIFILLSIFFWFTAYNAVTTAFSRYATTVWGLRGGSYANCLMVATVAAIISYIPIGFLSAKIGRKKTIMAGVIIMALCYFACIFFSEFHPVINIGFACIGFAWAAINVNSLPMVLEMSRGCDIGKYTGIYYTFSMSAQILTPILSGAFLQFVSYRTLFPYAFLFSLLALLTMSFVRHGDSRPAKKASILENYDAD